MFIVITVAGVVVWLLVSANKKAKTFVRSVEFLMHLDAGSDAEEANKFAFMLFTCNSTPDMDSKATQFADAIRQAQLGGKQLPAIEMARERGFKG